MPPLIQPWIFDYVWEVSSHHLASGHQNNNLVAAYRSSSFSLVSESASPSFISLTPVPLSIRASSGSPAELCQLRVDDEIVALNGVSVAHMSSSQWMEKLTSSLRAGSLTMDVRRYGNKGEKRSHKKKMILVLFSPHLLEMICDILTLKLRAHRGFRGCPQSWWLVVFIRLELQCGEPSHKARPKQDHPQSHRLRTRSDRLPRSPRRSRRPCRKPGRGSVWAQWADRRCERSFRVQFSRRCAQWRTSGERWRSLPWPDYARHSGARGVCQWPQDSQKWR